MRQLTGMVGAAAVIVVWGTAGVGAQGVDAAAERRAIASEVLRLAEDGPAFRRETGPRETEAERRRALSNYMQQLDVLTHGFPLTPAQLLDQQRRVKEQVDAIMNPSDAERQRVLRRLRGELDAER